MGCTSGGHLSYKNSVRFLSIFMTNVPLPCASSQVLLNFVLFFFYFLLLPSPQLSLWVSILFLFWSPLLCWICTPSVLRNDPKHSNLLSGFLSLTLRAQEKLTWERRGIFKGLGEIKKDFHAGSRCIAWACVARLQEGEEEENKQLKILIA